MVSSECSSRRAGGPICAQSACEIDTNGLVLDRLNGGLLNSFIELECDVGYGTAAFIKHRVLYVHS